MKRTGLSLVVIASVFGSGCIGLLDADGPAIQSGSDRIIGRLQTRDGVIDLTPATVSALRVGDRSSFYAEVDLDTVHGLSSRE